MRIADGKASFHQWDLNQQLIAEEGITEVRYYNGTTSEALCCLVKEVDTERRVDVPNILLQTAADIDAYGWSEDRKCVVQHVRFWVEPTPKPADYVYTQTEVLSVNAAVEAALRGDKVVRYVEGEGKAVQIGEHTTAEWRSLAAGYHTTANNTSFAAGRLGQATGKGSFASGYEMNNNFSDMYGEQVVTRGDTSIDSCVINISPSTTGSLLSIGDFICIAPADDAASWITTDAKQIVDLERNSDGDLVKIYIDSSFRHDGNYYEGHNAPEDGIIPPGSLIKKAIPNEASGKGSAVLGGKGNKATGDNSVVLGGEGSEAAAWNSLVAGWHLKAASAGQAVFGQWNEIDANALYAFILGWGTANARKNVFTIERKGNVWTDGVFSQNGTPSEDKHLVNLAYLNARLGETEKVFIAEYGVTTHAELKAAYDAGKALFCKEGTYFAPLYQQTSGGSFAFYRSTVDTLTNVYCSSSGWGKKATPLCKTKFGDIETALDNIITIQETLIGGVTV